MKRRLKLTPFAKIVFVSLIIAGAGYIYIHQDEIAEKDFFNFNDTLNLNIFDSNKEINQAPDTVFFHISENDSMINLNIDNQVINLIKNTSGLNPDTIVFKLPSEKTKIVKLIVE